MRIITSAMPGGIAGSTYTVTLQATGGTGAYTWSTTALPAGLTLQAATGTISGTLPDPAESMYVFEATVRDSAAPSQSSTVPLHFSVVARLTVMGDLAGGHLSFPYSAWLHTNSSTTVLWRVKSGALPPGLGFADPAAGFLQITGTPTQAGTFAFTIEAGENTESNPQVATRDMTITIDTAVKITTTQLKPAMMGFSYHDTVHAVNGVPPLTWSAIELPAGLALDAATGEITGTPTSRMSYSLVVTVTDASAPRQSDTAMLVLNMVDELRIGSDMVLMDGSSSVMLVSWGGWDNKVWSVYGALPSGVELVPSGYLQGTPAQPGYHPVLMTLQDNDQTTFYQASRIVTIHVLPPPLLAGSCTSTAYAQVGQPFQFPLPAAKGGVPPYTWSTFAGSLPEGITLDPGTGRLTGVASATGWHVLVAEVTDSGSPPQHAHVECWVNSRTTAPPGGNGRNDTLATATPLGDGGYYGSIGPYADPPDRANPDTDYYRLLGHAGDVITISVIAASSLDPVIELLDANGQRFTTCQNPTTGTYDDLCANDDSDPGAILNGSLALRVPDTGSLVPIYLHVLDERGDARPDFIYWMTIHGAIAPMNIPGDSLTAAVVGAGYGASIGVTGGLSPQTFVLVSGSLPPGLTMAADGRVSGRPTAAGRYVFTVTVTDGGAVPQTVTKELVLYVAERPSILLPDPLPPATTGVPYVQPVRVTGGFTTWLSFYGSNWLSRIRFDHQAFLGVPDVPGTYTGSLGAIGADNMTSRDMSVDKPVTLTVVAGPLSIMEQPLPDAAGGGAGYSAVLTPNGGTPPFTWSVVAGSLPEGLVLDAARGDIFGRPTTAGVSTFTIQVADAGSPQQTATRSFTLTVTP